MGQLKHLMPDQFRAESHRYETVNLFEADFIGQINTQNPEYQKAKMEAVREEQREYELGNWKYFNRDSGKEEPPPEGYLRIEKAMQLARQFQSYSKPIYSPSMPEKPFARDIRLGIIERIEKNLLHRKLKPEERARVKFFTAADAYKDNKGVGCLPLYRFHGISAWIEYTDEEKIHFAPFKLIVRGENQNPQSRTTIIRQSELPDPYLEEEIDKYETAIKKFTDQAFQKMFGRPAPETPQSK